MYRRSGFLEDMSLELGPDDRPHVFLESGLVVWTLSCYPSYREGNGEDSRILVLKGCGLPVI